MLRLACTVLLFLTAAGLRAQTLVPIVSYEYDPDTEPASGYADSGGELTDIFTSVRVWPGAGPNGFVDVAPLVGWLNTTAVIRFQFATPVSLAGATFFFADSNGIADVFFPKQVNLWTDGGVAPFHTQTLSDPAGNGWAVGAGFVIYGHITDHVVLEIPAHAHSGWVMMTGASFSGSPVSAVPEPSTYAAFAGIGALGFAFWRRRRSARNAAC